MSMQIEGGIDRGIHRLDGKIKPRGYWLDPSNIEAELRMAVTILERFPTQRDLKRLKATSLGVAITKDGGFNYWRENLGYGIVKRQIGYWESEENVGREIRRVIQEHALSNFPSAHQLQALGESAISKGMTRTGGSPKWRERLGFSLRGKPKNFWAPEKIEEEAKNFYEQHGILSHGSLTKFGRPDLRSAIGQKYSGGMRMLKEKLGLSPNGREQERDISPDQANEQLQRLLEVGNE